MRVDGVDMPAHLCAGRVGRGRVVGAAGRRSVGGLAGKCGALWCRGVTGESKGLLSVFRPRPTLVLGEARTRWTAFWGLAVPEGQGRVCLANEKLAYCLRGVKKDADPDVFMVSLGGRVVEFNPSLFGVEDVVFGLRSSPGWSM